MEFTFSEEQQAVAEAARAVFDGHATVERVSAAEAGADRFDPDLWAELARANLLGLAVPEAHGGAGLGLTEVCLVLEAQGRAVAPVPLWATCVLGAFPIATVGTAEQQARWLPAVADGRVRLSAAVAEVAASAQRTPVAAATPDGTGWRLEGRLGAVPQAHLADAVVVPATAGDQTVLVLVDPHGPGVQMVRTETTDRQVHPHLELDGAPVAADGVLVAGPDADAAVELLVQRAHVGLAAVALGVTEEALRRAAAYLDQRVQFEKPLSSFQGTKLRAADAYIDTEAIRVTLWQAAWRLDTGRDAAAEVAAAAWWASEAGQRVVHATQHLHGGIGADVSYPIHRYFFWGKQIELMLEGPSALLARLGRLLAAELQAGVAR